MVNKRLTKRNRTEQIASARLPSGMVCHDRSLESLPFTSRDNGDLRSAYDHNRLRGDDDRTYHCRARIRLHGGVDRILHRRKRARPHYHDDGVRSHLHDGGRGDRSGRLDHTSEFLQPEPLLPHQPAPAHRHTV